MGDAPAQGDYRLTRMATGGEGAGSRGAGDGPAAVAESSAEGIKSLNCELREHLTRLRSQLEQQKGAAGKSVHWQKVLDARAIRQQEQEKATQALHDLRAKHEREKARELALLRDSLVQKYEGELHKRHRHKEAEITKLRLELSSKEGVIRRLICESRRTSLRSSIDGHKNRLIHELSELRAAKKELEGLLELARSAHRNHSDELRRQEDTLQAEIARVRRDSQGEIRQMRADSGRIMALIHTANRRFPASVIHTANNGVTCVAMSGGSFCQSRY
ncbi:hypothetical protein ACOMHN_047669 [Nucella lapillus]